MTALPDPVAAFARQLAADHAWHATMQLKPLHPVVVDLLKNRALPERWQAVVLEWPHASDEDQTLLAYTPNEEKALKGIVVNLSPAKYIRKHWGDLADHEVRDVVARVANEANFSWYSTADDIVHVAMNGPRSCMSWRDHEEFDEDGELAWPHPYRAYAPELGWRMAVRRGPDGRIDGRALVYQETPERSVFVRSYRRTFEAYAGTMQETYSQSDEALEAWLQNQGIDKLDGWPEGTTLARMVDRDSDKPVVPYLDGCNDRFNFIGDAIRIEDGGKNCADCTDGDWSEGGDWRTCDHCGEEFDFDEGEHIYVGFREDEIVGGCCAGDFTCVTGRRRQTYYVRDEYVVWVNGEAYDEDYLDDNDIVELHDGTYVKEEDAVWSDRDNEYYRPDEVVDTEDEGWVPCEDAWQCAESGDWYSSNTEFVLLDGEKYHPDNLPDEEEEDDESPFDTPSTLLDVYAVGGEQTPAIA